MTETIVIQLALLPEGGDRSFLLESKLTNAQYWHTVFLGSSGAASMTHIHSGHRMRFHDARWINKMSGLWFCSIWSWQPAFCYVAGHRLQHTLICFVLLFATWLCIIQTTAQVTDIWPHVTVGKLFSFHVIGPNVRQQRPNGSLQTAQGRMWQSLSSSYCKMFSGWHDQSWNHTLPLRATNRVCAVVM